MIKKTRLLIEDKKNQASFCAKGVRRGNLLKKSEKKKKKHASFCAKGVLTNGEDRDGMELTGDST